MIDPVDQLPAIAWTQLWQITLVAVVVMAFVRVFCRRRPHLAYMLLMVVVLKCLTPPVWSSRAGVFTWLGTTRVTMEQGNDQRNGEEIRRTELAATRSGELSSPATTRFAGTASSIATEPSAGANLATVLIGLWLIGALALALLCVWRRVRYGLALRRTSAPAGPEVTELVQRLSHRLGLKRRVTLLVSSQPYGPLCFGIIRPYIVVPDELARQAKAKLEPILAHELAHVRRRDGLWAAVQILVGIHWWFHPLVWWVNREISRQRERCCDEEAVAGTGCHPEAYAQSLVDVLKFKRTWRPGLVALGIRPVDVTQARLEAIMSPGRRIYARTPWFCWLCLAAGLVLVVPGKGLVRDRARGDEPQQPTPAKKNAKTAKKAAGYNPREAEADVRKLIEQFVKAARDGDVKAAEKLLGDRAQPRAKRAEVYVEDTKKVIAMGAEPAKLAKVVAGPDRAIAVTEFFVLGKGTDREAQYCVLYQCTRQDGKWLIRDIDAERVAGLVDEIGRFVERLQEARRKDDRR